MKMEVLLKNICYALAVMAWGSRGLGLWVGRL
jgi:hypothetical protein